MRRLIIILPLLLILFSCKEEELEPTIKQKIEAGVIEYLENSNQQEKEIVEFKDYKKTDYTMENTGFYTSYKDLVEYYSALRDEMAQNKQNGAECIDQAMDKPIDCDEYIKRIDITIKSEKSAIKEIEEKYTPVNYTVVVSLAMKGYNPGTGGLGTVVFSYIFYLNEDFEVITTST